MTGAARGLTFGIFPGNLLDLMRDDYTPKLAFHAYRDLIERYRGDRG